MSPDKKRHFSAFNPDRRLEPPEVLGLVLGILEGDPYSFGFLSYLITQKTPDVIISDVYMMVRREAMYVLANNQFTRPVAEYYREIQQLSLESAPPWILEYEEHYIQRWGDRVDEEERGFMTEVERQGLPLVILTFGRTPQNNKAISLNHHELIRPSTALRIIKGKANEQLSKFN